MFWDREWRQAKRPAVALTASTAVRSACRPGAQTDAVTGEGRNPVFRPLCSAFPDSSPLRILYISAFKQPNIDKVSIFALSDQAWEGFLLYLFFFWTLLKLGEELSSRIFSITVPKHSRFVH